MTHDYIELSVYKVLINCVPFCYSIEMSQGGDSTSLCALKCAKLPHNGRDPKCQTHPLMGRCHPKSRPIMAIQTGCFGFKSVVSKG